MAIQTVQVERLTDANGNPFTITYDYDDVDLRIRAFHGDNRSPTNAAQVAAHDIAADRTYNKRCPANAVTDQIVPTGAAQRLQLFVNTHGKLDGVEWSVQFPG